MLVCQRCIRHVSLLPVLSLLAVWRPCTAANPAWTAQQNNSPGVSSSSVLRVSTITTPRVSDSALNITLLGDRESPGELPKKLLEDIAPANTSAEGDYEVVTTSPVLAAPVASDLTGSMGTALDMEDELPTPDVAAITNTTVEALVASTPPPLPVQSTSAPLSATSTSPTASSTAEIDQPLSVSITTTSAVVDMDVDLQIKGKAEGCVNVNHMNDKLGFYSCQCVSPADPCIADGKCLQEANCPDFDGTPVQANSMEPALTRVEMEKPTGVSDLSNSSAAPDMQDERAQLGNDTEGSPLEADPGNSSVAEDDPSKRFPAFDTNASLTEHAPVLGTNSSAHHKPLPRSRVPMALLGIIAAGCVMCCFMQNKICCFEAESEVRRPKPKKITQVELDGPFYGTYDYHEDLEDSSDLLPERRGAGSYSPPMV